MELKNRFSFYHSKEALPEALFILFLLIYLSTLIFGLSSYPLINEEPYRALVGLENTILGTTSPTALGVAYTEKNPLWLMVLGYWGHAFGWSEFSLRIPTIITAMLFIITTYAWIKVETKNKYVAFICAIQLALSQEIYFYLSRVCEIDLFHGSMMFYGIAGYFTLHTRKNLLAAYVILYFFSALAFLSWGIPSILHGTLSLICYLIYTKKSQELISVQHAIGVLFFILICWTFYGYYYPQEQLSALFNDLYETINYRIVSTEGGGYTLLNYLSHLVTFPLEALISLLPASLLIIRFFKKKPAPLESVNFFNFCCLMIGANILIYLLSPDARTRYLTVIFPFVIYVFSTALGPIDRTWLIDRKRLLLGAVLTVIVLRLIATVYVFGNKSTSKEIAPHLALTECVRTTFPDHDYYIVNSGIDRVHYMPMHSVFYLTKDRRRIVKFTDIIPTGTQSLCFIMPEMQDELEAAGYRLWDHYDFRGRRLIMVLD